MGFFFLTTNCNARANVWSFCFLLVWSKLVWIPGWGWDDLRWVQVLSWWLWNGPDFSSLCHQLSVSFLKWHDDDWLLCFMPRRDKAAATALFRSDERHFHHVSFFMLPVLTRGGRSRDCVDTNLRMILEATPSAATHVFHLSSGRCCDVRCGSRTFCSSSLRGLLLHLVITFLLSSPSANKGKKIKNKNKERTLCVIVQGNWC